MAVLPGSSSECESWEVADVRIIDIISDMPSTAAAIWEEFERVPPGTPLATSRLLRYGTRAAVDQALTRLTRAGSIERAARGVYYRPKVSRLVGKVPPEPRAVAEAMSAAKGESLGVHGAEAARQLGLTTQTPLSPVFLTSGRSQTVRLGKLSMRLQHVPARELALAGRPAGTALAALRYLGPEQATSTVIAQVRAQLPEAEFAALREETAAMPAWLSDTFFRFEHTEEPVPV